MWRYKYFFALLLAVLAGGMFAKEQPQQVVVWPKEGPPVLRFSFGKFKDVASSGHQHSYLTETTVENLWNKKIPLATFSLYLFDKNKVRIGEGFISLSNLASGEVTKFQTGIEASGVPVSIELVPTNLPAELQPNMPARTISITVNSVPQGAELKIDGTPAGTTPKAVRIAAGKHVLEFSKQGFNTGKFPLEIGPDDVSGGSVSYELGASAHDTVELRDGTVLTCDVESMSATEVIISAGGTKQRLDRNQVKRMLLVERDPPSSK
jgi:PEGA domain